MSDRNQRAWVRMGLILGLFALAVLIAAYAASCQRAEKVERTGAPTASRPAGGGGVVSAAEATYVPPGEKDDYYLFYSGGHSGNVFVAGIPSMRHIATIPVFTPYPSTGYGFDDDSKKMLGGYTWGDVHHPNLSKTNGKYDGRWLFVNDNANNRIARIDLRDFKTKQIVKLPNVAGAHCSAFVTDNTEYILYGTRFSIPFPAGTYAPVEQYKEKYRGVVGAVKIDQETGDMSTPWQIVTPPFDWDLGATGHKISHGWGFWTSYNSEMATGKLEVTASQNERDYTLMVNWKKVDEIIQNNPNIGQMINGVRVLQPKDVEGAMFLIPTAKSPHGVDVAPNGKWIVASGKLASIVTVFNFEKILKAIENKDFVDTVFDIPVLNYDSVKEAEVNVGLGPLHTQFDNKGYAYTSLFIDSAIAKWKLEDWKVVDNIKVSYNIGHLLVPGGDTVEPYGEYVIALNKLSHGRHLSVGPSQPESSQLIDIKGDKMRLLYDAFTEPEPHYAVSMKASELEPKVIEVYDLEKDNKDPNKITSVEQARVERTGPNTVEVWVGLVRSTIYPTSVEVNEGDTVIFHLTNLEQTTDELHGFGIVEYNVNVVVDPGETKHVTIKADKPGVYPYYCTNFCSALHQEMQGYLVVKPKK